MPYHFQRITTAYDVQVQVYEWQDLSETITAPNEIAIPIFGDCTVQVWGDFGVGGVLQVQGTLFTPGEAGPAQWDFLTDTFGAVIALTTAVCVTRLQNTYCLRPLVTQGTGVHLNVRAMMVGAGKGF